MRFKLDENLPGAAAALIREHGHDAALLLDQVAAGVPDAIVAELVRREHRTLVTVDLDFADIRAYPPSEFAGIIVLRPQEMSAPSVIAMMTRLVVALESQSPIGCLWIVENDRIRIHGTPR